MRQLFLAAAAASALAACAPDDRPQAERASSPPGYAAEGMLARSLPEISAALADGKTTSEELVKAYLARIEAIDRSGPVLQAVLTVNPDALENARASDARRAAGETLGPLDGVPILVKDNIETADPMATTAGALALKDNLTGRDSPLVKSLRDGGAIILGKTNLSQWANFRSTRSMSGWSALGGQVRNPHMLDRNPCGSSSGSGAAVAASLAPGAIGTETNGSIICPSNVNGVVGFKPTVGLISQQYIIPISPSQDTAGPMTKTVKGAAMLLDAMVVPKSSSFSQALDENALKGARIGVARFSVGSDPGIIARFGAALRAMEEAGAVLVEIEEEPQLDGLGDAETALLEYEFKSALNDYLADAAPAVEPRNLEALIAFNKANADRELALFGQDIFETATSKGGLDDLRYIKARASAQLATREEGIDKLLADYDVDLLVSPSGPVSPRIDPINGDVWPEWVGIGSMAAIAGYPHLSVPMGTVKGVPVGVSFIGARNEDAKILSYGYAYEQRTQLRPEPRYLTSAEEISEVAASMRRMTE